jgi:hypothetical protein
VRANVVEIDQPVGCGGPDLRRRREDVLVEELVASSGIILREYVPMAIYIDDVERVMARARSRAEGCVAFAFVLS